jgi:hypothetical protein
MKSPENSEFVVGVIGKLNLVLLGKITESL